MSRGFKRRLVHQAVQKTGLLNILSYKQQTNLKVLLYHSVSPEKPEIFDLLGPSMHVTVKEFREHMDYLKRYFNFIGTNELRQMKEGKEYERPLLLTFDDGYKSVYKYAFPICKELQIPFIVFVNGSFIDNEELFWRLGISQIFMLNHSDIFWKLCEKRGYSIPSSVKSTENVMRWSLRNLTPRDALDIPNQVLKEAGILQKELLEKLDLFLSAEEMIELNRHDWIEIGDHGLRHLPMIKLSDNELNEEISSSKKRLNSILKKHIDMFSFSFGVIGRDFDERCIRAVATGGYQYIFQVSNKINKIQMENNHWIINRISINDGDSPRDIRCMLYI